MFKLYLLNRSHSPAHPPPRSSLLFQTNKQTPDPAAVAVYFLFNFWTMGSASREIQVPPSTFSSWILRGKLLIKLKICWIVLIDYLGLGPLSHEAVLQASLRESENKLRQRNPLSEKWRDRSIRSRYSARPGNRSYSWFRGALLSGARVLGSKIKVTYTLQYFCWWTTCNLSATTATNQWPTASASWSSQAWGTQTGVLSYLVRFRNFWKIQGLISNLQSLPISKFLIYSHCQSKILNYFCMFWLWCSGRVARF